MLNKLRRIEYPDYEENLAYIDKHGCRAFLDMIDGISDHNLKVIDNQFSFLLLTAIALSVIAFFIV